MDRDGGLAEHERQQAERNADHTVRQVRIGTIDPPKEEEAVPEEKPKSQPRSRKRAQSK